MNWEHLTTAATSLPTAKTSYPTKKSLLDWITLNFTKAIINKKWYVRLTNKEYWNANIYTLPVVIYSIYLAIRARSPLFFTATNPAIPTSGMVGENKADISQWIPPQYRPKNSIIQPTDSCTDIQNSLQKAKLQFPIIMKPTVGCRGLMIKKVHSSIEILEHLYHYPTTFLLEEFIDYPIEAAVLYWKNPENGESGIQSVTLKEFLTVTGDGQSAVEYLLQQNPRGILQVDRLKKENNALLRSIPPLGEKVVVEHVGNHCRGTKFLNFNHLITSNMVAAFDKIQADLPGCYVFRLDLKTPSVSDLQMGKNIKILEINGVGSDPAHIYDPTTPFFEIWAAYFRLWKKIYDISTAQHRLGIPYMSLKEYRVFVKQQRAVEILEKS
jgi:hypothetical protein